MATLELLIKVLECISGPDLLCDNSRCIPGYLQCDGIDHCGDNSDERVGCFGST